MFCGIGTIRMGFEQAGHTCVYSVEWDKHKRKIYEVIFGNEPEGRDITAVRANELPRADCWTFGAPCQDFSIAGLRNGMDGDRSSLVREVFRLVRETPEEHRPEWLLYENVKGMLSSNKGLDYLEILFEMASLGYDIQYELLNSKDFGVPQNRERVYTLGHSRRFGERKVLPIGADNINAIEASEQKQDLMYADCGVGHKWTERSSTAPPLRSQGGGNAPGIAVIQIGNVMPTATRDNPNQGRVYDSDGLSPCLNKMEGGGREPMIQCVGNLNNGNSQRGRVYDAAGLSPSLCSHSDTGAGLEPKIIEPVAVEGVNWGAKDQNDRRFKDPGVLIPEATKQGYAIAHEGDSINLAVPNSKTRRGRVGKGVANTLDTSCNQATLSGARIRRLTPRECMRLQGVPDYITDKIIAAGISDTQMYRAAGDACTVNVIYEIAKRISISYIEGLRETEAE